MDWIYYLMAFLFALLVWLSRLHREKERDEFWKEVKSDYDKRNPDGPPFEY